MPFPRRPKDDQQVDYGDGQTVGRSQLLFFIRFIRFFVLQEVPHCASAVGRAKRAERCRRSRLDHVSILCTSTQSDSPSGANTKQGMTHHRPTIAHANARQTICFIWLARVPARFHFQRASRSYVNTRFMLGWFFRPKTRQETNRFSILFLKRFWVDFPPQLGSPSPPKSTKNKCQDALHFRFHFLIDF